MDCVLESLGRKDGNGYRVVVRAILKTNGTTVPNDVLAARSYALGGFNHLARHYNDLMLKKRKHVRLRLKGEHLTARDGEVHVEMLGEGEYGTLKLHEELRIDHLRDECS